MSFKSSQSNMSPVNIDQYNKLSYHFTDNGSRIRRKHATDKDKFNNIHI